MLSTRVIALSRIRYSAELRSAARASSPDRISSATRTCVCASIQAIAASPLAEASTAHEVARWGVDGVALLLPRLDAVTRTEWLLYGTAEPRAYLQALAGLLIYGALVVAAGLFDFQRENF